MEFEKDRENYIDRSFSFGGLNDPFFYLEFIFWEGKGNLLYRLEIEHEAFVTKF